MVQPYSVSNMSQSETNRVTDLFRDKTVLITGGTGFLGKVLIEKLLRCTSLKKIYTITRPKKGRNAGERFQELFSDPLFEQVRKQFGVGIFSKVQAIPGDVSAPDLGLTPMDRKTITEETEIIYHSAASIRFDEPMRSAIMLNVRGTKLMLELGEECKKLLVFCHVSTAYCHENEEVLFEKFYPSTVDPHKVIEMAENMKEEDLNATAEQIRGFSANNYTFTKALGEALIQEKLDKLPIILQRPTAVIPIWNDPLPGWTDNINGPIGIMIGAGKGVIRSMCVNKDIILDCLPVDTIIGVMLISVYDYLTYGSRRVFNITLSKEVNITIEELLETGRKTITTRIPFNVVLWYPNGSTRTSRLLHCIDFLLFQLLPAILIDALLFVIGMKTFMVRVQKRIWNGYKVFNYYANREWDFKNENFVIMRNYLNGVEKKIFRMDPEEFDFREYMVDCIWGARRYLLKEKDEGVPAAFRRMKMLWFLDVFCKTVFFLYVFYYVYSFVFVKSLGRK